MNFLEEFPDQETLLKSYNAEYESIVLKVNNHIHTPYSFSSFQSVQEAIEKALEEDVKILGINDFYVADGHEEFMNSCVSNGIFPLLNMELIGISEDEQKQGILINDPKNPGRIYVSAKGFAFPFKLPEEYASILDTIVKGSNGQVVAMISLLNDWMVRQGVNLELSAKEIAENYAMNLLRERHVARRLRLLLDTIADDQIYKSTLRTLYAGKESQKGKKDIAGTEDELRSNLLKAGSPAFVAEDINAFLPLKEIMKIIKSAGAVPCYPMLLDGAGDQKTDFEGSKERLKSELDNHGFTCVELIPFRNELDVLIEYAAYFYEQGYVVTFGTEHNTSELIPITVSAKGGVELTKELRHISFMGAAWQAAHHYLLVKEGMNYHRESRNQMEILGKAILYYYFESYING